MKRFKKLGAVMLFALLTVALSGCGSSATSALITLPEDDAAHSDAETEWWYYHAHLNAASGEHYAFHYVVFQVAIPDHSPVKVAHLSISDPQKDVYTIDQKLSLAPPRYEGTRGFAFDIDGWKMSGYAGDDRLSAFTDEYAFDLSLNEAKPPVFHQDTGLISLGEAGDSFYYSRTRLDVLGTISVGNLEAPVTGQAWFDHQWGNFDPRPIGWDWFALQMSDGSDVMLSLVRDEQGQLVYGYGTLVAPDGNASHLADEDLQVSPTGSWISPASGATYPSGWGVSIPGWGIDVVLIPVIVASEFDATLTTRNYYWEGEVTISGSHGGKGFVELSGYAENLWDTGG